MLNADTVPRIGLPELLYTYECDGGIPVYWWMQANHNQDNCTIAALHTNAIITLSLMHVINGAVHEKFKEKYIGRPLSP